MCRSKQTPLRRGFLFKGNANELRTVCPDPFHPGVLPRVFWAGVKCESSSFLYQSYILRFRILINILGLQTLVVSIRLQKRRVMLLHRKLLRSGKA